MEKRLRMSVDHIDSFASSVMDRSLESLLNRTSKSQPGKFDGPSHANTDRVQLNASASAVRNLVIVNDMTRNNVDIGI